MCATSTPIFNIASTASCCPTASARSGKSSTPASSAALRCSPARCRRNLACARRACSTSRPRPTPSTIPAASASMAAATARSRRVSNMAARPDKPSISCPAAISQNNLGIENPTPSNEAIHDRTSQEKGFLYLSTVLDPTSRLTFMSGVSNSSLSNSQQSRADAEQHGLRRVHFRFGIPQRTSERVQPVQRPRLPEIGRRHRLPGLLFQPLQPVALLPGPDRRSGLQRRLVGRLPSELRQRHSGRYRMARRLCPHAAVRIFRRARSAPWSTTFPPCCRSPIPTDPTAGHDRCAILRSSIQAARPAG